LGTRLLPHLGVETGTKICKKSYRGRMERDKKKRGVRKEMMRCG